LDGQRVGVWGASAGGHLAALVGTAGDKKEWDAKGPHPEISSRVQAVVDWFGPTDLVPMVRAANPGKKDNPVALLLGGPGEHLVEKARQASPVTYVSSDDPPFLIQHGDADRLVPLAQSRALADKLRGAGVEVTLVTIPGAGHGDAPFRAEGKTIAQVAEFFERHLKKRN